MSKTIVTTEKELANAIKRGEEMIEIEGDLKNQVIKIRAKGNVTWLIAIGAIGAAVILVLGSGGIATPAAAALAPAAIGVLGTAATYTSIAIAVAAGGVASLNKLRNNYKEISRTENSLLLARK